jgi:hypothetical protein
MWTDPAIPRPPAVAVVTEQPHVLRPAARFQVANDQLGGRCAVLLSQKPTMGGPVVVHMVDRQKEGLTLAATLAFATVGRDQLGAQRVAPSLGTVESSRPVLFIPIPRSRPSGFKPFGSQFCAVLALPLRERFEIAASPFFATPLLFVLALLVARSEASFLSRAIGRAARIARRFLADLTHGLDAVRTSCVASEILGSGGQGAFAPMTGFRVHEPSVAPTCVFVCSRLKFQESV